ncbi:hypothetical protein [Chelativorans sp. AA-79]|nr:hypothetical protein [Chelativorans sp. AA-79]WEX12048.1 hypothetical protein PVE73_22890 [Chelativorans sp. AA-79]
MVIPPTGAPISPLRQRTQHDMLMRGLGSSVLPGPHTGAPMQVT